MNEAYFQYLCDLVGGYEAFGQSFCYLLKELHQKDFYSVWGNDENRAKDGLELRSEWGIQKKRPCSILEMMIALAQRMNYIMLDDVEKDMTPEFFWKMIDNLGLLDMDDEKMEAQIVECQCVIDRAIYDLVERKYSRNGDGGLFPLRHTSRDQRKVDIYVQANTWLMENYVEE